MRDGATVPQITGLQLAITFYQGNYRVGKKRITMLLKSTLSFTDFFCILYLFVKQLPIGTS